MVDSKASLSEADGMMETDILQRQASQVRIFADVHDVRLGLAHRLLVFCDWDEEKASQLLDVLKELLW